jgi:hypothetical protein
VKGVLDGYYVSIHHSILSLYVLTLCQKMFPTYLSKEKRIVELGTGACATTQYASPTLSEGEGGFFQVIMVTCHQMKSAYAIGWPSECAHIGRGSEIAR